MGSNREPDRRRAGRSPQELLDGIRARGTSLRRRRAVARAALAVTLPVTTLVAAFVALPRLTPPPASTINVAGGPAGRGPGAGAEGVPGAPEPGEPAVAASPSPSVSPSPSIPAATAGPATKPPKRDPGAPVNLPAEPKAPEVTAAPADPGPGSGPAPSPLPTPAHEVVPCEAGDVAFAVTADKDSYQKGEDVVFTMTLRNTSSETCGVPQAHNACNSGVVVVDGAKRQVWPSGPQPMWACVLTYTPLEAGATTHATFTWDQTEWVCDATGQDPCYERVAPGVYTATGHWIGGVEAGTSFKLL